MLLNQADSLVKIDTDKSIRIAKKVFKQSDNNLKNYIRASHIIERAFLNKKENDSAFVYADKGYKKAMEAHDTIGSLSFIFRIGRNYYYKNDYKKALFYLKQGISFYENYGDSITEAQYSPIEYADLLSTISSVYSRMSKLDSSITYEFQSYNLKLKNNASIKSLAGSKMNLGNRYHTLQDYKESEKWLTDALQDAKSVNDKKLMAMIYINLGSANVRLDFPEKAVENYKKSIALNGEIKRYKAQGIGALNLAGFYMGQEKHDLAEQYFKMALNSYNKVNIEEPYIYEALGELYLLKKEYLKSIKYSKKAFELAKKSDMKSIQKNVMLYLSDANSGLGKNTLALDYLKKHIVLKDSILNKDKQRVIQTLKTEFETEQKEKEIAYLKELNESENQKAQAIQSRQRFLIIASVLGLALLLVILLAYRYKKKKEKRLMAIKLENQELINKEYELDIEHKTKQLTTHALNMLQKNKMLTEIKDRIKELSKGGDSCSTTALKSISRTITQTQKTDKDWDLFKRYFESINKDFNQKLAAINSDLTTHDYRLAALVSLNLNIKETAALLNISPNSVKIARHRLRKRLQVKKGDDLYTFITSI